MPRIETHFKWRKDGHISVKNHDTHGSPIKTSGGNATEGAAVVEPFMILNGQDMFYIQERAWAAWTEWKKFLADKQ